MQKFKVNDQSIPKIEWKQTDIRSIRLQHVNVISLVTYLTSLGYQSGLFLSDMTSLSAREHAIFEWKKFNVI